MRLATRLGKVLSLLNNELIPTLPGDVEIIGGFSIHVPSSFRTKKRAPEGARQNRLPESGYYYIW